MSDTLALIRQLVSRGEVRVSDHGYEQLAADGILVNQLVNGVTEAVLVEDYADFYKGPCVLALQTDSTGCPVHAVWGVAKGTNGPAVLVTAYRPDPSRWSADFLRRKL